MVAFSRPFCGGVSVAAVGGEASCTLHSDQGDAAIRVWIPE